MVPSLYAPMESRLARVSLVLVAFVVLMVAPASGGGLVSCRPNIFGGEDCTGPRGRSSSRPNIFGGYDTTYADGSRTESGARLVDQPAR